MLESLLNFAYPAAFGDLLAALLALIAILALVRNAASARLLVWVFHVEGTLDLFNAITLATIYQAQHVFLWKYWKERPN